MWFQMQTSACIATLPHEASDAAVVGCCVPVCLFVRETEEWERLGQCTKSVLSGCVTTKLKFVPALNIHSQLSSTAHCSSLGHSKRLRDRANLLSLLTKWPYVTTLCVPSLFSLCHLASNEHRNGSPLPSKRTQICVPVCFKHLLRPHLAESALG